MNRSPLAIISLLLFTSMALFAQQTPPSQTPAAAEPGAPAAAPAAPAYTPKYRTDPARSDAEFEALAYMRVVMRAEVGFNVGGIWKVNEHINLLCTAGRDIVGGARVIAYVGLQSLTT